MIIKGKTVDDRLVIAGLYEFCASEGIPLDVGLQITYQQGFVPCWVSLYQEAKKNGMSHLGIITKIENSIQDIGLHEDILERIVNHLNTLYYLGKL